MPKIQLIRRDSQIIELEAETISFVMDRLVAISPIPILAQRIGVDMNQSNIGIEISGVLTDDDSATGGVGSAFTIDTSMNGSKTVATTWYELGGITTAILDGVRIKFSSIGQIDAGLGEDITILLNNGSLSATVDTNSIIPVNIASITTSDGLTDAIKTAIEAASVKVNTATTSFTSIFTVTQSAGQMSAVSSSLQSASPNHDGEKLKIANKTNGSGGNSVVSVTKGTTGQEWNGQFYVSNMNGGKAAKRMTKGDKVQDLFDLSNMSAGGALVNPSTFVGDTIDIPSSVSSFDASRFLRIDEADAVKKYIVGVRIPYESLASSSTASSVLRQFVIPAGIGASLNSETNTKEFDPTSSMNNEVVRPNPFVEQGVAIPCSLISFKPSYEAGDSVWTFDISLTVVEQLVGL